MVLLPAFDSWLSGGASDELPKIAAVGTLDWIFAEYRADRRFTKLDPKTKRLHESGMRLVGDHFLKDGRRLGGVRLAAIDTAVTDALYERLLTIKVTDAGGNEIERERRVRVNHAMKSCRRAWNVALRRAQRTDFRCDVGATTPIADMVEAMLSNGISVQLVRRKAFFSRWR
jgi:hypothetical protein